MVLSKKLIAAVAASLALLIPLTGCSILDGAPVAPPSPTADSGIAPELRTFYEQIVDWKACGGPRTYCGQVTVPADWSAPSGDVMKLAVAYRAADNEKVLGSVIFNPGGPGASGYSWIKNSVEQLGTKNLRANFNLVGFDPRGVGESVPAVKCLDAKATDALIYGEQKYPIGSEADLVNNRARLKNFAEACARNTGKALGLIDTESAARDLDVLRAVFGDSKINYLGFSYGTFLGNTYAALFPQRVGHMVLDGAINPLASASEENYAQLRAFDQALHNYLNNCTESADCPFKGTTDDAENKIVALLSKIEKQPLKTDSDRELTIWGAINGLVMPLYSNDWWPSLSQAFTEALKGDGTTFLSLADTYNDRNPDGTYASNVLESNIAISCLDSREPTDAASMAKQNARMLSGSKVFGRYWQNGALSCEQWPYPLAKHPSSYAASGSAKILVLGTTGDPATPYADAVALANEVLANAQLVTYNGEGHTAYGRESSCINKTVDAYFIENVVPTEDPNCG